MKLYNRASNFWRFFTTRLAPHQLYSFCEVYATFMYPLKRVRILRVPLQILLPPSSNHPDKTWRILDTYDWLSPKYQWKHTYSEVEGWFKKARLTDNREIRFSCSSER